MLSRHRPDTMINLTSRWSLIFDRSEDSPVDDDSKVKRHGKKERAGSFIGPIIERRSFEPPLRSGVLRGCDSQSVVRSQWQWLRSPRIAVIIPSVAERV